jgi:1-acyl-sn-glycerol-3-phosphate acyltransferase
LSRPFLYALSDWVRFRSWYSWLYRVEVMGCERVPAEGPVILVANHESMIDPWLLGLVTPRPVRFMAKAELWKYAPTRWLMEGFGAFPVSRGLGDRGAVGRAAELLGRGEVLGMFPQGTCLPYRRRPWLRGAARLALSTGAPVVPVCIVGSEKALRPGKFKLGLPRIRVIVCESVEAEPGQAVIPAAKELTARMEVAIEDARAPYGPPAHAWFPEERVA